MNKHLRYFLFILFILFASFFFFAFNESDIASDTETPFRREPPKAPVQRTIPAPPPGTEPTAEVVSTLQSPLSVDSRFYFNCKAQ